MTEILIVSIFSFLAIGGVTAFALRKLKRTWKEKVCICRPEYEGPCNRHENCGTLKEINADFLERRNEFWFGYGQIIVILVIVTILAVLLILNKISSEAAMTAITGLGGFTLGKNISSGKNKMTHDTKPDGDSKTQEKQIG
jgi:hypothetical protein